MRHLVVPVLFVVSACTPLGADVDVDENPLPEFVDDCDEALNDNLDDAAGLVAEDGVTSAELCTGDRDYYRIDIPAGTWVSVKLEMDGSGEGDTDLDLWELEDPNNPVDAEMDFIDDEDNDDNVLWYSATAQEYERLAWYNDTDERMIKYLAVDGYEGAWDDYELTVQTSEFHGADELDCDEVFDDSSEDGPCNQIMQFPQANSIDDGYLVSHEAHYSNLRREVIMLVRYAAAETAIAFPDTKPLGLLDMGEDDGDVPGRMRGQLRHPEGTHVNGNDLDIAYYQNINDNLGRPVCPQNDNYFCTGPTTLLDSERTAYFMVKLMESPNLRVIGVDPAIAEKLLEAATELRGKDMISSTDRTRLNTYMAYGDGWPFHHHHMHVSWDWEDGWAGRANHRLEGCRHDELTEPTKVRLGVGR